jgi:hypothetical protein
MYRIRHTVSVATRTSVTGARIVTRLTPTITLAIVMTVTIAVAVMVAVVAYAQAVLSTTTHASQHLSSRV